MIDRRAFLQTGLRTGIGLAAGTSLLLPATDALAQSARGIDYGSNKLDIYSPGTANAPVLVYVHGGAWRAGSRGSVGAMPSYFNSLGYVFVSVGYTLHPRADVDRQSAQIGQAISWIRNNIAQYGGDSTRIALVGHSAGCHLACLATLSGRAPAVRALIANDTAAYDVAYLAQISGGKLGILYAAPFRDRSKWRNWSPISYAGGGGGLPVMVAWSGGGVRPDVSQRFANALANAGHPVTRFNGTGYNHLSIRSAMGKRGDRLTQAMTNFLAQTV